jgi:hypothetical protein
MVLFAMGLAPQPTVDHYWKEARKKPHGMYGNLLYFTLIIARRILGNQQNYTL